MEVNEGKGRTTHVFDDGILRNTPHRVLDVLFDEGTESGVIEFGGLSVRIRRTVFPKLNYFITEDKINRQGIRRL